MRLFQWSKHHRIVKSLLTDRYPKKVCRKKDKEDTIIVFPISK